MVRPWTVSARYQSAAVRFILGPESRRLACALQNSVREAPSKKLKIVDIVSIRSSTTKGIYLETLATVQQF